MYTSVEWSTSLFFNLVASAIQIGMDRWIVGQARGNLSSAQRASGHDLVVRVRAAF